MLSNIEQHWATYFLLRFDDTLLIVHYLLCQIALDGPLEPQSVEQNSFTASSERSEVWGCSNMLQRGTKMNDNSEHSEGFSERHEDGMKSMEKSYTYHVMKFKWNMLNIQIVANKQITRFHKTRKSKFGRKDKQLFTASGACLLAEQTNHRLSHAAVASICRESRRSATCASQPSQIKQPIWESVRPFPVKDFRKTRSDMTQKEISSYTCK